VRYITILHFSGIRNYFTGAIIGTISKLFLQANPASYSSKLYFCFSILINLKFLSC